MNTTEHNENAIAVIGLAGRFPGAPDVDALWEKLKAGEECITFYTDEQLRAAGIDDAVLDRPDFVKAKPALEAIDQFDASYFGFNPTEAAQMDPQHRIFLECCVAALENAAIAPEQFDGSIGIFGGSGVSTYWPQVNEAADSNGQWSTTAQTAICNIQDYLCSRAAYKLNLKGPCYTVQSACSTSLVAVHLASQHLQNFECDVALAGGVSITVPEASGYFYQENGIVSPDGHCRPFDAKAAGTIFGSGAGVVVLKRLADAIADRDPIQAIILGSAINNDGSQKAAYTAPSVSGQSRAIAEAIAIADISPETIHYVEAHGTATPIGDPIEVAALTQAYQLHTQKKQYCTLGSIKSNMGHLDTAAGITGFIKTVLSLKNKAIAPTLHFESPNPKIDFESSPFYVSAELQTWPETNSPKRAAVSSFGVGGSNAHVILEEAPKRAASAASSDLKILRLSAKSEQALDDLKDDLANHLEDHPTLSPDDVIATLSLARNSHPHRTAAVCNTSSIDPIIDALDEEEGTELFSGQAYSTSPQVTFLFPGQGSQYVNMARELYLKEPVFKAQLDNCATLIRPHIETDLLSVLFTETFEAAHSERLQDTKWTQPALFAVEYSLAQLLIHWGIRPQAMIGHSIGEYVAACIAGVFSLQDALILVARRGQLVASLPSGSMLAISAPAESIKPKLNRDLSLAVVNSPNACVIAGSHRAIDAFEASLADTETRCRRLHTSHAFHSHMMDGILPELRSHLSEISFHAPTVPYLSNLTGTWILPEQATDPEYWLRQLRRTVLFTDGIQEILKESDQVCIEVGPGRTLSSLSRQQGIVTAKLPTLVSLLPDAREAKCSHHSVLRAVAQTWVAGVEVNWSAHYENEKRNKLALPTYPFQRERYWVEAGPQSTSVESIKANQKKNDISQWFYLPSWRQNSLAQLPQTSPRSILLIADTDESTTELAQFLKSKGHRVVTQLDAESPEFDTILHVTTTLSNSIQTLDSLTQLAQKLTQLGINRALNLLVAQFGLFSIFGNESLTPEHALTLGPCKVIPQEYPHITCRNIDLQGNLESNLNLLAQEILSPEKDPNVAFRNQQRWTLDYQAVEVSEANPTLTSGGVYWITGGLGGIGRALASALAAVEPKITLILSNRRPFPLESTWDILTDPAQLEIVKDIRALRAKGTTVEILPLDICDAANVTESLSYIQKTHGPVKGIVHAAGIAGGKIIELQDRASIEKVLAAKVTGTQNIIQATEDLAPDFIILCSSLAALTGGIGQLAYVSANAALDATAHAHDAQKACRVISINWDAWLDTGMTHTGKQSKMRDQFAITREEGIQIFQRILALPHPQVIISTAKLPSRLITPPVDSPRKQANAAQASIKHPRPPLNVDFIAASTELEKFWVSVWENILSIKDIGIQDNFFELGGDSLTALQLTAQIKEDKGWNLTVTQLYQSPTIQTLSQQNLA